MDDVLILLAIALLSGLVAGGLAREKDWHARRGMLG